MLIAIIADKSATVSFSSQRMVEKLRSDELAAFREAFDMFDKNADGTISTKVLCQLQCEDDIEDVVLILWILSLYCGCCLYIVDFVFILWMPSIYCRCSLGNVDIVLIFWTLS